MINKGMHLAWIVGKDFEKTIKFYTEIIGLKLINKSEEYQWAELQGESGAFVGLSAASEMNPLKAGQNAILTFSVENIEQARDELQKNNVELLGDIMEIPGEVKLQLFKDSDGNMAQFAQLLKK